MGSSTILPSLPETSARSAKTIAVTASNTGGTRKAIQRSWRPFTEKTSCSPVSQLRVTCSFGVLEVGLIAMRNTSSLPLVMPPTTPPAWLVRVRPTASSIGSLWSTPNILAASKPVPNSTPLTAGMAKTAWLIRLSTEFQNGSPSPTGRPVTRHSTMPPTESFWSMAFCSPASISFSPPISIMVAVTSICFPPGRCFNSFLATTPAPTRQTVNRPLKWPPPL